VNGTSGNSANRALFTLFYFSSTMKSELKEARGKYGPKPLLRAARHNGPVGEKVSGRVDFWVSHRRPGKRAGVLKAQLTLAATTARNTRVTAPVWAAAAAILCSTGIFAMSSFASTLFLPLA